MHNVIELHFDLATENRIRSLWRTLIEKGYAKDSDYLGACPHISLTSSEPVNPESVRSWFATVAADIKLESVEFSFLGLFPGPSQVLFLGVTPNKSLLAVQEMLYSKLSQAGIKQHPLLVPNRIVFHTTLVPNLSYAEIAEPIKDSLAAKLPLAGLLERIALVEYPGGQRIVEQSIRA